MKTDVKLFKIVGQYDGKSRSAFIYAADENQARSLFELEFALGTENEMAVSSNAIFVADTKAEVEMNDGALAPRFLAHEEKMAWWKRLEPDTYKEEMAHGLR